MKKKKLIKMIIGILILSIMIFIWLPNHESLAFKLIDITGDTTGTTEITTIGNKVIQIISTIGSILSVIVIIVLGIKYMMGSVEEKASYKKTMLPFLIGAIFIFAASTIASLIYNVAINI